MGDAHALFNYCLNTQTMAHTCFDSVSSYVVYVGASSFGYRFPVLSLTIIHHTIFCCLDGDGVTVEAQVSLLVHRSHSNRVVGMGSQSIQCQLSSCQVPLSGLIGSSYLTTTPLCSVPDSVLDNTAVDLGAGNQAVPLDTDDC